jgi:hypothetical protein
MAKKYKPLFQTFVGWQIIRHDENWPTRIQTTIGAVRLQTIHRQSKTDTLGSLLQILDQNGPKSASLAICRMRHNIRVFTITFLILVPPHLLCCFFR